MISGAGLRFHHFGLAATDPGRAIGFLERMGYRCGAAIIDPLQNVILRWCEQDAAPPVEVVSPTTTKGPLSRVLAEQPTSFYHLCYEAVSAETDPVELLRATGARLVTVMPPTPAVLFGGRLVSFHLVQGFGLVELLQGSVVASADLPR